MSTSVLSRFQSRSKYCNYEVDFKPRTIHIDCRYKGDLNLDLAVGYKVDSKCMNPVI